jgi:hypothetical protein
MPLFHAFPLLGVPSMPPEAASRALSESNSHFTHPSPTSDPVMMSPHLGPRHVVSTSRKFLLFL